MDVERLHGAARRVQALGEDVRGVAVDLRAARGVVWESVQAERYREELGREAAAVRRTADVLERACAALLAHAEAVQRRLSELAALEHRAAAALDDARSALADAPRELVARVRDAW